MIQTLTNNEFPATDIIQLGGNKNPRSVTNYSMVSEKQQEQGVQTKRVHLNMLKIQQQL